MPLTLKVAMRSRRDEAYLYIIITVGRHQKVASFLLGEDGYVD